MEGFEPNRYLHISVLPSCRIHREYVSQVRFGSRRIAAVQPSKVFSEFHFVLQGLACAERFRYLYFFFFQANILLLHLVSSEWRG